MAIAHYFLHGNRDPAMAKSRIPSVLDVAEELILIDASILQPLRNKPMNIHLKPMDNKQKGGSSWNITL
jgi:hypothetical protein